MDKDEKLFISGFCYKTLYYARKIAVRAFNEIWPDPRNKAVDNKWNVDDPFLIDKLGEFGSNLEYQNEMKEILPNIFICKKEN